jgi:membrane protein insertase Oxa1/YidC/SpoIIIJ
MDFNRSLKQTPEGMLKTLSFIHVAMLAFQMLFAIAAFAQSTRMYFGVMNMDDKFVFIAPVLALGGFFGGFLIFKKQKYALRTKENMQEKLTGYQSALISRFLLVGAPSLFAVVAYILSGNVFFIFITAIMSMYFMFLRPTREKIENDLHFDFNDQLADLEHEEIN